MLPTFFSLPLSAGEQDVSETSIQTDYLCLYAWNKAESNSWPIGQVRKLVFTETNVSVSLWDGEDICTLPYDNVRKITFEEEALANDIETTIAPCTIHYDELHRLLVIKDICGSGHLQLYNVSGALVFSASVSKGKSEHSLINLPVGVYIAKLTDQEKTYLLKLQIR